MREVMLLLNTALLALAIIATWVLIMRGNAWAWMTAYWAVSVLKSWVQLIHDDTKSYDKDTE